MQVRSEGLEALFLELVRHHHAAVAHEAGHVGGLAPRRRGHIHDAFTVLGRQGHDGEERGRPLHHVVAAHVLGGGPDRHLRLVDHKPRLRPLADGVQVHTPGDERRRELPAAGPQGVCPERDGALVLAGLQELQQLGRGKHVEVLAHEEVVVVVHGHDVAPQLREVILARPALLPQGLEVAEDLHDLPDAALGAAEVQACGCGLKLPHPNLQPDPAWRTPPAPPVLRVLVLVLAVRVV